MNKRRKRASVGWLKGLAAKSLSFLTILSSSQNGSLVDDFFFFFNVAGKGIELILIDFPTTPLILSSYLGQK